MKNYKESTVIYESAYLAISYLPDDKTKWEAMEGLLKYGFYGEVPESDNPFVNMIYVQAIPSMRNAKQRYDKAVENGKKGGRPSEISTEEIISMKEYGMTNKQIAEKLGCSEKNIENRITTYNKSHPNNPNNLSVSVSVSDSVSVSSSVSESEVASLQEEKSPKEEEEKIDLKSLLQNMNCEQLSEIKNMYDNNVPYKEIAKKYNITYFDAKEFVSIYDSVHDEQYEREHQEKEKQRQEEINQQIRAAQPEINKNREQLTALCSILFPDREVDDRMLACVCKRIDKIKDVDAFIDYHKKNPSVSINCKGFEQTYNTIKSVSDEYVNPIDYYITYVQDMMRYEQSIGA